jgi:hypothetical protein
MGRKQNPRKCGPRALGNRLSSVDREEEACYSGGTAAGAGSRVGL